ncbi:hypothetical protein [Tabrizicola sp.]|uniref:hypothetical protein n=1 Tax=Tabrizicola sp. TaxID=2005166 RepID=UPI0025E84843|nr:hypothetical protein [Tabrizicola sp.]MBY0350568.1 hypothetical protein [Tabrizicola sp.]MDK2773496.1 hypothetical protein [Tabrizicola sp.]
MQKVFEQRAVSDPSLTSHIRSQHFETDFGALQDRIQGAVQRERNSRHGRRHAPEVDRRLRETSPRSTGLPSTA